METEQKQEEKGIVIEFRNCMELTDFKCMGDFVKWCNTYTREGLLVFHIMKNYKTYLVQLRRDEQLPTYIKSLFIYQMEGNYKEIEEFIFSKFKRANPKKKEVRNSSQP